MNEEKEKQRKIEEWKGPKGKGGLGVGLDWARKPPRRDDGPITVPKETSGLIFPKRKKNHQ